MAVKEVYSIRINKGDEELKDYLDQFPVDKQNSALKTLLKYGIEKLESNMEINEVYKSIKEAIQLGNEAREKQLDEIKMLITQLQANGIEIKTNLENEDDDELEIDFEKTRESMQEALSMFTG